MATLKREEVDGRGYRDLDDARARIGSFIADVYNRQRLHQAKRVSHMAFTCICPQPATFTL